ncbi:hypothetical protein U27_05854 [Candidatus Vecturithrix granuli]|uniref:Transglutaminase-like domain-containing protein n=1 Tax=Vecturithrix granuli TaxID=1499967 RepID=A0A081C2S4_VECG1|nr:hypothetical protein U27_05854 [Candidatus Vecturithrix granuli]
MRFLFYFRLSSYLLIGSGFLALLITEDYGMFAALIFAAILAIGWQVDSGKWRIPVSPLFWNLAMIAFLLVSVADVLFFRRIGSIGLVNFLIFLQTAKIFSSKRDRDYITIYVISFFLMLITSIMTFSVLFALSCILFAVTATWALSTLTMKRDIEMHLLPESTTGVADSSIEEAYLNVPALSSVLNGKFFAGTFGVTLASFIISLAVFVILPRFREGMLFRYGSGFSQRVSGFSEEVALDSFGVVRLDHRPVMRVTLPKINAEQTLPFRLYWKGLSYNHYDGLRWRADAQRKKHIRSAREYEHVAWFGVSDDKNTLLEQRVELISSGYEVLFAANAVQGAEGRFLGLYYDQLTGNTQVIYNPYAPNYTAYSDISRPADKVLQQEGQEYPEEILTLYLQTPDLPERVIRLAHEIRADTTNPYQSVLAIQEYLEQNYAYSLDVQRSSDVTPLEDFLFVNKAGHCEYYATSMTILLRILGIPTRLVNGFAQGRWNEYGQFFTVRQSDAHAWVEVYFPSAGWVTFDPTPAAAFGDTYQEFAEQRNFLANVYRYSEYLRTKWNRYVIDFSTLDQAQLAVSAFRASRSARRNLSGSLRRLKDRVQQMMPHLTSRDLWTMLAAIPTLAFLLYLIRRTLRYVHLKFPKLTKRRRSARKQVILFYQRMLHILARKGMPKHVAATPGEFAQLIDQKHPAYSQDVQHITNLYYAVRYGQHQLQQEEILSIEHRLRELQKKQRTSAP